MCVLISRMFVDLNLSPLYSVRSRNVSSFWSASNVNLIVGWIVLIFWMYSSSCVCVPVQTMKMSSMYLFHSIIFGSVSLVSSVPIKRFA